ncbi:MAG: hypothetical protein HYR56_32895 [Acidobacteria bacterium]|nr:hypothetical protein [Acidobacteriota bacterium]MBI3426811.1 hypothetical protein [Acidobacteriota bacterium]
MKNALTKLAVMGGLALAAIFQALTGSAVQANVTGPPSSRTGAPNLGVIAAEPNCTACHGPFLVNGGPGEISLSGLPPVYTPGQEIAVTVSITQSGRGRFGFEAMALEDLGRRAGELRVTEATRTRLVEGQGAFGGRQYIQHLQPGTTPNPPGQNSWSFLWRAPAQSVGRVTFYVAVNAADGTGGTGNDYIYTTSQSLQPAGSPVTASAASLVQTGSLTVESIATLFGANLSDGVAAAATTPLPVELAGAKIRVRDQAGVERDASLFFAAPSQINYLIPRGTGNGIATISALRNGTVIGSATQLIETVAPALFTANATGQGVPAAVLLRRNAAGQDRIEPVTAFNSTTGRYEAVPLDLGPVSDQVFLIAFGSGFRNRVANNNIACLIGEVESEVLFLGAQGSLEGVDQLNVRIPRNLAGRGEVPVQLNVNGKRANTVTINFR